MTFFFEFVQAKDYRDKEELVVEELKNTPKT